MDNKQIQQLVERFIEDRATANEVAELTDWYRSANEAELEWLEESENTRLRLLVAINQEIGIRRIRPLWPRIAVAASVLIILSFGSYFLMHKTHSQETAQNQPHDILPGSNKAVLITHGKQISITDAKNGLLVRQGNTSITKVADGQLAYNNTDNNNGVMVYDTLIIPRGGQHELVLADGSKLFLNADTKLRFPEHFAANERRIELISGQVRLHVVHNAAVPFFVTVKDQTVKDIGTDFDINAYDDEPSVKTTLIEGSVEVAKGTQSKILKPGQQAVIHADGPITLQPANIDQVTAWNRGQFYFEKTSLRELIRQVSRWYNIDVIYQGNVSDDGFTGQPSRKANLSQMLKILQYGDVHFKIEPGKGKSAGTLIVTQ